MHAVSRGPNSDKEFYIRVITLDLSHGDGSYSPLTEIRVT